MKLKRKIILERYAAVIDAMYRDMDRRESRGGHQRAGTWGLSGGVVRGV
ncbi:hypothetical protein [Desulfosoma sp.]